MTKSQVVKIFESNILLGISGQNENEIQEYLEKNTDFIPTPILMNHGIHFDSIISKLHISDSLCCDFAYLTKSSVEWRLVLIELEPSTKTIFNDNKKNINFSAEFNNSYDQILSWRVYLHSHAEDIKERLSLLMGHMIQNPISFEYLLVIGRDSELNSNEKKNMFAQKNRDGIRVFNYDSLMRWYLANRRIFKNVLSKTKHGFELKEYYADTALFAYINSNNLFFNNAIKTRLIADGYDIPEWEKGNLLSMHSWNGKKHLNTSTKNFDLMIKEIKN